MANGNGDNGATGAIVRTVVLLVGLVGFFVGVAFWAGSLNKSMDNAAMALLELKAQLQAQALHDAERDRLSDRLEYRARTLEDRVDRCCTAHFPDRPPPR